MLGQHPQRERVDRADGGVVHVTRRDEQAGIPLRAIGQGPAHAQPQLGRRGFGEGDGSDRGHGQAPVGHQ